MPSMRWIRDKAEEFISLEHEQVKNNLDLARFNRKADVVSELVLWFEGMERIEKMGRKTRRTEDEEKRYAE